MLLCWPAVFEDKFRALQSDAVVFVMTTATDFKVFYADFIHITCITTGVTD
jgi:hypothetical protein